MVLLGNLAFCCRVSAETARFAGRDPEALDRVGNARVIRGVILVRVREREG